MSKKIAISQLGSLLICEYRIYLKYVVKAKEKVTKAIQKGKDAHEKLKVKHDKVVKEYNDKVRKIVKSDRSKEEKKTEIERITKPSELDSEREYSVIGNNIRGRIDEIQFKDDYIKIIDDKRHTQVFDSDKIQVYAYCLAYQEQNKDKLKLMYPDGVKFKVAIKSYQTEDFIWEGEYTEESKKKVIDAIDRYNKIIEEKETPTSTSVAAVCKTCGVRNMCDKKVKPISVEEFLG